MEKGMENGSVIPYISSGKATAVPASELWTSSYRTGTLIERPVESSQVYERTARIRHEDKQSGSYERYNRKEKASNGELHVEKGTGQVGVKDELIKCSTFRIGNKGGYTEYRIEERFQDINFGKSNDSKDDPIKCHTHPHIEDNDNDEDDEEHDENEDDYESDSSCAYEYDYDGSDGDENDNGDDSNNDGINDDKNDDDDDNEASGVENYNEYDAYDCNYDDDDGNGDDDDGDDDDDDYSDDDYY